MPERTILVKRNDPATVFQFAFKITSGPLALDYKDGTAFFRSATGLKVQQDVQPYPEGGVSTFQRSVMGQFKWPNIVLSQGFTGDKKLFAFKNTPKRLNGMIFQLGPKLNPLCRSALYNALTANPTPPPPPPPTTHPPTPPTHPAPHPPPPHPPPPPPP